MKRGLVQVAGCSMGIVDRLMGNLRRCCIIDKKTCFSESGGQIASAFYRVGGSMRSGGAA